MMTWRDFYVSLLCGFIISAFTIGLFTTGYLAMQTLVIQ
jgi:hypothetical protein